MQTSSETTDQSVDHAAISQMRSNNTPAQTSLLDQDDDSLDSWDADAVLASMNDDSTPINNISTGNLSSSNDTMSLEAFVAASSNVPQPVEDTDTTTPIPAVIDSVFGAFSITSMAYRDPQSAEQARTSHWPTRPQHLVSDSTRPSASDNVLRCQYVVALTLAAVDMTQARDSPGVLTRWKGLWTTKEGQRLESGRRTIEQAAWHLLAKIEEFTHNGPRDLPASYKGQKAISLLNLNTQGEGAFAQHVDNIAAALRARKTLCMDVVDSHNKVSLLVADTNTIVARKEAFKVSNDNRKTRYAADRTTRQKVEETMAEGDKLSPVSLKRKLEEALETNKTEIESRKKVRASSIKKDNVEQQNVAFTQQQSAAIAITTPAVPLANNLTYGQRLRATHLRSYGPPFDLPTDHSTATAAVDTTTDNPEHSRDAGLTRRQQQPVANRVTSYVPSNMNLPQQSGLQQAALRLRRQQDIASGRLTLYRPEFNREQVQQAPSTPLNMQWPPTQYTHQHRPAPQDALTSQERAVNVPGNDARAQWERANGFWGPTVDK